MGGAPTLKTKSVKFNFMMNMILTVSSFVFPLITFPYVSRVLLVEGNGYVSFATSVLTYFTMYTASIAVRTEYSVVKMVSLGVSANCPRNAKFTQPSGITSGLSPFALGMKNAVM